jgi:hypothetical protein
MNESEEDVEGSSQPVLWCYLSIYLENKQNHKNSQLG